MTNLFHFIDECTPQLGVLQFWHAKLVRVKQVVKASNAARHSIEQ